MKKQEQRIVFLSQGMLCPLFHFTCSNRGICVSARRKDKRCFIHSIPKDCILMTEKQYRVKVLKETKVKIGKGKDKITISMWDSYMAMLSSAAAANVSLKGKLKKK